MGSYAKDTTLNILDNNAPWNFRLYCIQFVNKSIVYIHCITLFLFMWKMIDVCLQWFSYSNNIVLVHLHSFQTLQILTDWSPIFSSPGWNVFTWNIKYGSRPLVLLLFRIVTGNPDCWLLKFLTRVREVKGHLDRLGIFRAWYSELCSAVIKVPS